MKTIKNHLRYRFYRVIIPTIVLLLFYTFTLIPTNFHTTSLKIAISEQIPYSFYIDQDSRFIMLCIMICCIWVFQFYMMFQDVHRNKTRILILPQSRNVMWLVDASIFFFSIFIMLGIHFAMYAYGFQLYQDAILEHTTFAYWQTNQIFTSLHETGGFVYLFPSDIAHWIFLLIVLKVFSYSLPFVYTIACARKKSKYERVYHLCIMGLSVAFLLIISNIWLKSLIGALFIVWMLKILRDCWQSSQIGG